MPVLSMFYGIIVSMFYKEHNPPHIHIQYADIMPLWTLTEI